MAVLLGTSSLGGNTANSNLGRTAAFAGLARESEKRLPRQAESLNNPGVAPTDESGRRLETASIPR